MIEVNSLKVTDHAKTAQNETVKYLESKGYFYKTEVVVDERGDGRTGRVNIVAKKNGRTIGIEVDRCSPRKKSINKLKQNDFDTKVVLCRGGKDRYMLDDIFVIPIQIK